MSDKIEELLNSIEVDGAWHSLEQHKLDDAGIDIRDLTMRLEDRAMNIGVDVDISYTSVQSDGKPYMHMIRVVLEHRLERVSPDFWKAMYE